MLVLTTKVGERLQIGDTVIHFKKIGTKRISVGVDAPAEVVIRRVSESEANQAKESNHDRSRSRRTGAAGVAIKGGT